MSVIKCNTVTPLHDGVIVSNMNFDVQKTESGIIVGSDDGKSEGIKPRWAKVYSVGKDQKTIKADDWILIEHGRWTRSLKVQDASGKNVELRRVEVKSIIMINDRCPTDVYLGKSNKSTVQTFDFSNPMF